MNYCTPQMSWLQRAILIILAEFGRTSEEWQQADTALWSGDAYTIKHLWQRALDRQSLKRNP